MKNNFNENLDSNEFFQSLPSYVQETIEQSGITLNSEEELKKCANTLMNNK